MPTLQKSSGSRRNHGGDFLAVLLLVAFVAGFGWLWWREKHPKHVGRHHAAAPVVAVTKTVIPEAMPVAPVTPVAEVKVAPKPDETTAPIPAPISVATNAPETHTEFPRPPRDMLEAQVALVRRVISPGPIDGALGSQTRAALAAFQRSENLFESRSLDTNTRAQLTLDAPAFTTYTVTTNDVARLQPLGKTWLAKSQQSVLDYETILELVGEKFHAHVLLIKKLNPDVIDWNNVPAGTVLKVPDVDYPVPEDKATFVVIHLSEKFLEAFDADTNLIAHFPCSIAAKVEKRPVGELHVAVIAPNPNYTFDPELFPESPEAQQIGHKLIIPPGPNNPVGVAWVGLDKPGYGIHGTPVPEQVGRTESHGCFRLANWDAKYFMKLAWVGLPVEVVP